jgi:hypothetical protein
VPTSLRAFSSLYHGYDPLCPAPEETRHIRKGKRNDDEEDYQTPSVTSKAVTSIICPLLFMYLKQTFLGAPLASVRGIHLPGIFDTCLLAAKMNIRSFAIFVAAPRH